MSAGDHVKGVRVSGAVVRGLASYLRRASGAETMERLCAEAGLDVSPDDESQTWFSGRDLNRLADLAEAHLGEPELGRRTGEEMFRIRPDVHPFFHSEGSIGGALKQAVTLGSRTRTEAPFLFVDESDTHLVVRATNAKSSRFACGISAGYWSQIPALFGSVGTVAEPKCVTRGDPHCEFRVSWEPVASPNETGVERSRSRGNTLVGRFEELLSLAAELTAAETLDDLLQMIADRAIAAVLTPGVVAAVRFTPSGPLAIGVSGIEIERATEIAHGVDMGLLDDVDTICAVPIASPRQHYGSLIAVGPEGSPFSSAERRMLASYAGHATAAIEGAAALAEARAARDAAEALLGLAGVLSSVGTTNEIAQRIAEAVPSLVECDFACMVTLDGDPGAADLADQHLRFAGAWPHPVESLGIEAFPLADAPVVRDIIESATPAFRSTGEIQGLLRLLLRAVGANSVAAAPVVIRDEVVGLVVAASAQEWNEVTAEPVLRRLAGLGDHAATALDNSRLLHHVQHQALHDSLTGLPNRTLVKDRVEHALALAERVDRRITVLFVDVDRFKEINDQLGHAAGDEVLRVVATRLNECVRASDTVARLGGDEFLVLLENTCGVEDGARVAEKITQSLRQPIVLADREIVISVSVGITSGPGRGSSYDDLLATADQAMYQVKRSGRDGWQVYSPVASEHA